MKSLARILLIIAVISPMSVYACAQETYFSLGAGGNYAFNHHKHNGTGWYGGGAFGMRFSQCLRADFSVDFLRQNKDLQKFAFLLNGYYDFNLCSCFTPYIGVGLGYVTANHHLQKHNFGFQVGTGVRYRINECYAVSGSYRLLGITGYKTGYHHLYGIELIKYF